MAHAIHLLRQASSGPFEFVISSDFDAAGQYVQIEVIAPNGDISITAKKVDIVEARETANSRTEQQFKQSGITLSVGSPVLSAIQQGQSLAQAAGNTSSVRMQALAGASAALNVLSNADAIGKSAAALASGNPAQAASITASIGSSQSQSLQKSQSDSARSSSVTAGGNVSISATALRQAQDERGDGNLTVQGSSIQAGNNASLAADNEIKLLAAQNTSSQVGTSSSSSASVGISYGAGGWGISASAAKGKGSSDGADTGLTNTQISAGNTARLQSGGNTSLKGAVIATNTVIAQVGGNLNIESLQDTSTYTSAQTNVSASVSVGGGNNGASFSASQSKIDSNFKSVGEQSGIKAGGGGFQVNVANNTDLKGAVIASNQSAVDNNQNSFTTGGTLTTRDIQNTASFSGSAASVGVDVGQQAGKFGVSGVGAGVGSDKGSAASTSAAGISGIAGNTAVRSTDAQAGLKKIFDAAKVQREIDAQVQITQAFSKEAPKAVATYAQGRYDELKVSNPEEAKKWAEGGVYRVALHTATGALGGGLGGALGAGASASSANLMNGLQDSVQQGLQNAGLGEAAAKAVAQGVSTLTAAGVGAVVGGAQGAAVAATVDANNRQLHPTERNLAKELAASSKGKYTVEQIEAAMRLSGVKGSSISPDTVAVITNPASSDPSARGARFDNGMPLLTNTGPVLVEQSTSASPDLIAFVQQATGGAASPYYWSEKTSNPPTTSNTPPDTGGPRYYSCATSDCLLTGGNRNPDNLQNQAEAQRAQNAMGSAGLIVGAPVAVLYGGPVLFGMAASAQTTALTGGIGAVTGGKWVLSAALGGAIGSSLEYVINPEASPASMIVGGVGGAVGAVTKLGLNAGFGLANQWVPTTLANIGTAAVGSQLAGKSVRAGLNESGNTSSGTSWWTSPISSCGLAPRKPC